MNKTISWQGYEWLTQETWGVIHPSSPYKYFDSGAVFIDNDGYLRLSAFYKPANILHDGIHYAPNTAIGLVSCQHPFHFGDYEVVAKLPVGEHLWPAIWLYDLDHWPPEIDIIEAYSNSKGSYFQWKWPIYNLQSNFHYRENEINKDTGGKVMYAGLCNPSNRFIKFGMKWRSTYISILINGKERRRIEGDVMKYYQRPMRFLINNGVQKEHDAKSIVSDFIIKSFNYKKQT